MDVLDLQIWVALILSSHQGLHLPCQTPVIVVNVLVWVEKVSPMENDRQHKKNPAHTRLKHLPYHSFSFQIWDSITKSARDPTRHKLLTIIVHQYLVTIYHGVVCCLHPSPVHVMTPSPFTFSRNPKMLRQTNHDFLSSHKLASLEKEVPHRHVASLFQSHTPQTHTHERHLSLHIPKYLHEPGLLCFDLN